MNSDRLSNKWMGWLLVAVVASTVSLFSCSQTDSGVTMKVKSKLAVDSTVKAYKITVDTRNRVVTLTGNVDTPEERDAALRLARDTTGVVDVVDRIAVRTSDTAGDAPDTHRTPGEVLDDAAITMAVKAKLLDDPQVRGLKIDVDTREGIVYLTGIVRTPTERDRAVQLARETNNVHSVEANLKIEQS